MDPVRRIGIWQALKSRATIAGLFQHNDVKAPIFELTVIGAETDQQNIRSNGRPFLRLVGHEDTNKHAAKVRVIVVARDASTGETRSHELNLCLPCAQ